MTWLAAAIGVVVAGTTPTPTELAEPLTPSVGPAQPARSRGAPPSRTDVLDEIVVSSARTPRPASSLPTTVQVLGADALRQSAASTPDAALRALPSFQTFRRSTSLAADPSSQGLSLRGVGPGGVSRALLLDDGVPANDPFGGWVVFRALPRLGLERIEVAPGGASALYGNYALGGVVALVPRPITGTELEAESAGGGLGTAAAALRATHRAGALGVALDADALATDGYPVVARHDRGPVDRRAGADHARAGLRLTWDPAPRVAAELGGSVFGEAQDGGTRFTTSGLRAVALRGKLAWDSRAGRVEALAFGGLRRFTQERARIDEARTSEARAARQEVPSRDLGAALVLAARPLGAHRLTAGADVRRVGGSAGERLFPADPPPEATVARRAEGTQLLAGLFAEDAIALGRVTVAGALRLDAWRNGAATLSRTTRAGDVLAERLDPRARAQLSPRLAAVWRAAPALLVRASAYRAFRAPTLNELYRTFQVGTLVTAPDPGLRAETLTGAELGPELLLAGAVHLRATAFWSVLEDPVVTVTLPEPRDDGATRQRANLGRARVRGVEASAGWSPDPRLAASLAWTFVDARLVSAPGFPALAGRELPQDPRHRLAAEARLDDPRLLSAALSVRWVSRQWEDDRNTLAMPGYAVVDATLARRLSGALEVFAAAENLLDRRYLVGRAGVDTVGAPRLLRAGLRWRAVASPPRD